MKLHSSAIGRAGEYFVASVLELHGVQTAFVDRDHSDLWCVTPSGRFLIVQVKSALLPRPRRGSRVGQVRPILYYSFGRLEPSAVDICVYAALDRSIFIARPLTVNAGKTFPEYAFTHAEMEDSITTYFS